ncbi:MAG: helix-turn-helix domain-containing protein [Candidatus Cryptobacteroides sp.]
MQERSYEYAEMVSAFGAAYLSGKVSRTMQGSKFCMVDNLEDVAESPEGMDSQDRGVHGRKAIRYPHRITMSFCIYCKSGRIRARIQQKDYSLGSGDVLLLFTGQILEYADLSPGCRVIFIAIDSEFILTQIRNKYGEILRDWVLRKKEPTQMHLEEGSASNFEKLCASIKYIISDAGSDYADGIVYGFTTIFANLLTSWHKRDHSRLSAEEGGEPQATNAQKVLLRFQNDIRHFALKYKRVSYYAKRQNLSLRQFSRLIGEASGEKPSALIDEYLILEAKSLLQTGNYSVHQVCGRLGFDNDSFFNRWFKRIAGLTPGRYQTRIP